CRWSGSHVGCDEVIPPQLCWPVVHQNVGASARLDLQRRRVPDEAADARATTTRDQHPFTIFHFAILVPPVAQGRRSCRGGVRQGTHAVMHGRRVRRLFGDARRTALRHRTRRAWIGGRVSLAVSSVVPVIHWVG